MHFVPIFPFFVLIFLTMRPPETLRCMQSKEDENMKKTSFPALILALSIPMSVASCSSKDTTTTSEESVYEPQYRTESEVVRVTQCMMPQVIEKNVTYVQKEKDGAWEQDSYEITNWGWDENFVIVDTVWKMHSDDAKSLYTELDDTLSGVPADVTLYVYNNLWGLDAKVSKDENGTPFFDIHLHMYIDVILEVGGERSLFEGAEITGVSIYEDGTTKMTVKDGGVLIIPSDVTQGTWDDYLAALPPEDFIRAASSTYITSVSFTDLPTFEVTSPNIENGYWDPKITDTKYGENISPEINWDAVEGATNYVVIMIDSDWLHMDVFTTETHLEEGAYGKSYTQGEQYVGPYPPSMTHTYSVFVFALKNDMGDPILHFNMSGNSINKIYESLDIDKDGNSGNVIAFGRLDANYTHKD